jgi:hypothetical protein
VKFCAGLGKAGGRNPDSGFCRCAGRLVEGVFTVNVNGSSLDSKVLE